jgi:hypothetical protein
MAGFEVTPEVPKPPMCLEGETSSTVFPMRATCTAEVTADAESP